MWAGENEAYHKSVVCAARDTYDGCLQAVHMQAEAPGGRIGVILVGACDIMVNQLLSCFGCLNFPLVTMPTVDWVLLRLGESNKGWDFGGVYCSLSADAPAAKACNN